MADTVDYDQMSEDMFSDNYTAGPVFDFVLQDFLFKGLLVGIMVLVGIPLNVLTIIGFSGVKNKSSHTVLLQCLAAADVFFLFWTFFEHSMWHYFEFFNVWSRCAHVTHLQNWSWLIGGMHSIAVDLAMWSVVLVTLDRWIAIYLPTRAQKFCQIRVAVIAFLVVCLYVCAFNGHYFFTHKYTAVPRNASANNTLYDLSCGQDYVSDVSDEFKRVYYFLDSTLNLIMPMVLVVGLDAGMIIALRRSRKRMGKRKDEASSSATIVLVLLATSFVLCQIPELVHILLRAVGKYTFNFEVAYTAIFFQVFNSFSNFFIYILIGRTFRSALKQSIMDMCKCCIPQRRRNQNGFRAEYSKTGGGLTESMAPAQKVT